MKRNPNAKCGNCPYFYEGEQCRASNPTYQIECQYGKYPSVGTDDWCGQHPDFWEAEATEVSITYADGHTECVAVEQSEPPTLEEIARLLNGGEHAEALKELRRMHGLVDRFVCTNCGNVSSSTGPGFVCRECGGYLTTRVVEAKETGQ